MYFKSYIFSFLFLYLSAKMGNLKIIGEEGKAQITYILYGEGYA